MCNPSVHCVLSLVNERNFLQVDLIWKSKWTFSKVVFLLARYPTFVDVPLILYCEWVVIPRVCLWSCAHEIPEDTLNRGMSYDVGELSHTGDSLG